MHSIQLPEEKRDDLSEQLTRFRLQRLKLAFGVDCTWRQCNLHVILYFDNNQPPQPFTFTMLEEIIPSGKDNSRIWIKGTDKKQGLVNQTFQNVVKISSEIIKTK
ncbi:hypothetical protein CL632_02270 [bacterium]|jgi:hypothetical protein|nr:hypothetical protein [bacterium]MDP6571689.1 hypothetical protein [Patescibacteria group bacterium]